MLVETKTRPVGTYTSAGKKKKGSVQRRYVGIRDSRQDVLVLHSSAAPNGCEYRAIIEVSGINFLLKGEQEQLIISDLYQHLLASLTHPIQILMRVLPLDLSPFLRHLTPPKEAPAPLSARGQGASSAPARGLSAVVETIRGVWRELAFSLKVLFRGLAENRTLLERHFYLVVPADADLAKEGGLLGLGLGKKKRGKRRRRAAEFDRARQQLALRVSEISRQLSEMGLTCHRLSNKELVRLYHSCLMPRKARRYPLPEGVLDGIDRPITASIPPASAGSPTAHLMRVPPPLQAASDGVVGERPKKKRRFLGRLAGLIGRLLVGKRQQGREDEPWRDFAQLADVVAPASVVLQPDALCVEQDYNRVIVVDALPRNVALGFMRPLVEVDEPMEVSLFYRPNEPRTAIKQLSRKRVEFRSTRNYLSRRENPQHPELAVAEGDVDELIPKVASGEERMLDVSMYVLLRGASPEELDERADRLMTTLSNMMVVARSAVFEQDLGFRSCLPECRNLLDRTVWLDGTSAAIATFPFISNTLFMSDGILEGITPEGEPVVLDWWSPEQRNANRLVIAPSGSGKSYKCKIDLARMFLRYMRDWDGQGDPPAQFFVIDPDGEWQRECALFNGQYIVLAPGSPHHINPFALPARGLRSQVRTGYGPEEDLRTDVLAETVQQSHALLEIALADRTAAGAGTLTASEKGFVDRCLYQMYRNAGITSDPSTHGQTPPTMKDLYEVMADGSCGPDPTGLASRLRRYVDGSLAGLFAGQTNVELNNPVVVFHVPRDVELRALIYFLISRHVWQVSFGSNIPRMLIVDEMLSLYEHPEGAHFLDTLFQRSRKHYLSLVGIVQQPAKLRESTIPANCATVILMKQEASSLDFVADLCKLSPQERHHLGLCSKGDALLLTNQNRIFVHFVASDLEHRIATTDPVELARWEEEERLASRSGTTGRVQTLHVALPRELGQWNGAQSGAERRGP
jgi:hypothetical protein